MTDHLNTGGAAFPFQERNDDGSHHHSHEGMTLRDYFAAHADGFSDQVTAEFAAQATGLEVPESHNGNEVAIFWSKADAIYKYMQADAMLAARGGAE